MRTERGQATVEWIGVVLLMAIALTALSRFARRDDDRALASTLVHTVTCAAHDGCERHLAAAHPRVVGIRSGKRTESQPPHRRDFTVPVLVPDPGEARPAPRLRLPSGRQLLRWARTEGPRALRWGAARRLRRGVGVAWRRAWFACLAYERFRWAFLHPESRFPGYTMPPSEALRIANDCISPLDLVRDWPMLTERQP
jgi:hypothetical protein